MEVCSYQPLAEDKVSIVRCELKEVLGKVPTQGTRTLSGNYLWMSLHNKAKSNNYTERIGVKSVGTWNES